MRSGDTLPWHRLAVAAAALLAPAVAAAAIEAAASDAGARMLRLADNVFVIEHDDATDEWPHGNTGVIVGRTGVFVIDSGYLPSRARADIALIRRVTDKPVRFLVTTHWHFDHNNGAIAYVEAFPGVTLLAERNTARWIELNQEYWKALSTAPGSARREALATLETELARGTDADGTPSTRRSASVARRDRQPPCGACGTGGARGRRADAALRRAAQPRLRGHADRDRGPRPRELSERRDSLAAGAAHPVRRRHRRPLAAAVRRRLLAGALVGGAARPRGAARGGHRARPRTAAAGPRVHARVCAGCWKRRWSASKSVVRAGRKPRRGAGRAEPR